jgi:peptidoglycan/LPS O-acetylase OafA/YrhL
LSAGIIGISIRSHNIPIADVDTRFFIYFFAGAFAAVLRKNELVKKVACSRPVSIICLICLATLLTLFSFADGNKQLFLLTLFFIPVALGNSMFGLLTTKAAIMLGEMSYSIYLLHGIVLYIFFTVLFPRLIQPTTPALVEYGLMVSLAACVVVISWLTFTRIEMFGITLGRRVAMRFDR